MKQDKNQSAADPLLHSGDMEFNLQLKLKEVFGTIVEYLKVKELWTMSMSEKKMQSNNEASTYCKETSDARVGSGAFSETKHEEYARSQDKIIGGNNSLLCDLVESQTHLVAVHCDKRENEGQSIKFATFLPGKQEMENNTSNANTGTVNQAPQTYLTVKPIELDKESAPEERSLLEYLTPVVHEEQDQSHLLKDCHPTSEINDVSQALMKNSLEVSPAISNVSEKRLIDSIRVCHSIAGITDTGDAEACHCDASSRKPPGDSYIRTGPGLHGLQADSTRREHHSVKDNSSIYSVITDSKECLSTDSLVKLDAAEEPRPKNLHLSVDETGNKQQSILFVGPLDRSLRHHNSYKIDDIDQILEKLATEFERQERLSSFCLPSEERFLVRRNVVHIQDM
ncbi:hypothetical protein KP509_01G111300 [Ceratopteris richardii]|uniref:Uncharacterized protein n=1 Tax=Ceratopteris richardii TaxID=49495 RepID=A0A8T2VGB4_CERRI|nr:hypothetical protein KP509_01G111300 [Ceratopteris richardii]